MTVGLLAVADAAAGQMLRPARSNSGLLYFVADGRQACIMRRIRSCIRTCKLVVVLL
jgi:hypothetical protein